MELTLGIGIFVFFVQFISFFVKGIAGFGDPLISQPLMSMTQMNTSTHISPLNLLMQWPLNLFISIKNRKRFSIKKTLPMIICILVGMLSAMFLMKGFSAWLEGKGLTWVLKAGLGALIVFCGVEMLTRKPSKKHKGNFITMALVSVASGITAGLYGINLFFVAYIERTGYVDRDQFRGQMCFIFFIENTVRLIIYIATGIYTSFLLKLAVISLFGVAAGMFVGTRVDKKLSDKTVHRIIMITFIVAGLSTLVKALIWKI